MVKLKDLSEGELRSKQLARLEKFKTKLSPRGYNLMRSWTINWEFTGKRKSGFELNLKNLLK